METATKTKTAPKSNKKVLFTFGEPEAGGITVHEGDSFLVKDKKDGDAPTGYVAQGVTKLPSDGIGEDFNFPFKPTTKAFRKDGKAIGVYDTGFEPESKCYRHLSPQEQKKAAKILMDNVLKPYQAATGITNAFLLEHPETIDDNTFYIESGVVLNMDDPIARMTLYAGLLAHQLTPLDETGNPVYKESAYCVVETTKVRTQREEDNFTHVAAMGVFYMMMKQDKPTLIKVLAYLGIDVAEDIEPKPLSSIFMENTKGRDDNTEAFLDLAEAIDTKKTREEVEIYYYLRKNFGKGTDFSKLPNGNVGYKDQEIGTDLKTAAANIAINPTWNEIKTKILVDND